MREVKGGRDGVDRSIDRALEIKNNARLDFVKSLQFCLPVSQRSCDMAVSFFSGSIPEIPTVMTAVARRHVRISRFENPSNSSLPNKTRYDSTSTSDTSFTDFHSSNAAGKPLYHTTCFILAPAPI